MIDKKCDVEVGTHYPPYYRDVHSDLKVCSRHRNQYDERTNDLGPFSWELRQTKPKTMDNPIQKSIDCLREILNVHENHLYPDDEIAISAVLSRLIIMQKDGFK